MKTRKTPKDYDAGTIQHTCGVPVKTFKQLSKGVDKGFDDFFARRGRKVPYVSSHEIGRLTVEAMEMIEAY